MYKIEIHKEALKFLNSLNADIKTQIIKNLEELETNPYPQGVIKVKGYKDPIFRLRVGKYRALYFVNNSDLTVYIIKIDKRSRVYD